MSDNKVLLPLSNHHDPTLYHTLAVLALYRTQPTAHHIQSTLQVL